MKYVGFPLTLIDGKTGVYMKTGTNKHKNTYPFSNTFFLKTNLKGPISYSNNFIKQSNFFGDDSTYFTSVDG